MTIEFPGGDDPVAIAAKLRALADDIERMTMFTPTAELDDAPVLEDWNLALRAVPILDGRAVGHPILGSREVSTSEIFAIDADFRWVRTFSRFYRLGRCAANQEYN
ncbi:MAG: hypothetical protein EON59_07405 [Alphaproteobacteria bacterium]|nr:MAG: hypothetical protein EON59_07405 [Alphaproteobacteria bacterium]